MCYAFVIPNTFFNKFCFTAKNYQIFGNFRLEFADLLVIAIFTGNCLKQFHFTKGSEQKSKKYEKFCLCTVSRTDNVIMFCNLSNKLNTMSVSCK